MATAMSTSEIRTSIMEKPRWVPLRLRRNALERVWGMIGVRLCLFMWMGRLRSARP